MQFDKRADGLRGIAALSVVFAHYVAHFVPVLNAKNYPGTYIGDPDASIWFEVLRFPLFNIFYNGQFAVMIFFVLSGYVLTLPAHAGRSMAIEPRYWARYLRLNIPVAASILLVWLLEANGWIFLGQIEIPSDFGDPVRTEPVMTFLESLKTAVYGAVLFGEGRLNVPLWSIGVEFIGSLLLLAFFIPQRPRKWVFVAVSFVIGALVFTNSVTYLIAIFAGAWIAKAKPSSRLVIGLGIVGVYLGAYQTDSVYYSFLNAEAFVPSTKNVFNMFGAIALTTAAINGFCARFLDNLVSHYLGKVSFALYITHYCVLLSFGIITFAVLPPALFHTGMHFVIYVVACLGVATLFETLFDRPAIRISKRFAKWVMQSRIGPKTP